jgi:hypothetical protein
MPVRSDDELAQRVGRGVLTFRWTDGFVGQLPLWGGQLIGEGGLEGGLEQRPAALFRHAPGLGRHGFDIGAGITGRGHRHLSLVLHLDDDSGLMSCRMPDLFKGPATAPTDSATSTASGQPGQPDQGR